MKYGFMKVASAIPAVKVGDVIFNTQQIEVYRRMMFRLIAMATC